MLKNTENSYGLIARLLHWVISLSIIGLITVGFYMSDLENSPEKLKLYGMHKAFGVMVFSLIIFRIVWRFSNKAVLPIDGLPNTLKLAAKLGHFLLYVFMLVMPISGIMMSRLMGYDIPVFDLFTIPALAKNELLAGVFYKIHTTAIWGFITIIALHIGAAFYHHFIRKDNTLLRMLSDKS